MKLKTVRNKLLEFKNTPFDGQDYETVAHLIAGNQLIAAANHIEMLDTIVRDTMKIVIMNNCPKVYYEMFDGALEFYGDDQGVWSEFAEEGLYGPYHNEEGVLQ